MMTIFGAVLILSAFCSPPATQVEMCFAVRDVDHNPIKDADICIFTKDRMLMPYQDPAKIRITCRTDSNGTVSKRLPCWDGYVDCHVVADGYYKESLTDIFFKSTYDKLRNRVVYSETSKNVSVCLMQIKNPVPLYAYRGGRRYLQFGKKECMVGYDLKMRDCLPPEGKGVTADFFVHHQVIQTNGLMQCVAELTFPKGGGAYVVQKGDEASRPLVYQANTNALYETRFQVSCPQNGEERRSANPGVILTRNEALVIRSRVELSAAGDVVSANYSKIYGPFTIVRTLEFGQSCFNPRVNDVNLEFDIHKNLTGKTLGVYYP